MRNSPNLATEKNTVATNAVSFFPVDKSANRVIRCCSLPNICDIVYDIIYDITIGGNK